jgi:lipid-A-disaccharide synthase
MAALQAAAQGATRGPRIVIVAGEASGDQLGAALIEALRAQLPDAQFAGIPGPLMQRAGCEAWLGAEELAVMGLFEIIPHLPRLLRIRRELIGRVLADPPAVYIGVDFKEFNLSVARRLKSAGVRTVQYVSPQVWAWRERRVHRIGAACDLLLCLLPFEPPFYERFGVRARFVGHPLADQIALDVDRRAARAQLGVSPDRPVAALLPGSRAGEVTRLGADFIAAARELQVLEPTVQFVAPMANAATRTLFEQAGAAAAGIRLVDGQSRTVLQAADVALVASGTATLEALLCRCPMVVAYRLGGLTAWLLRTLRMVRLPYFSLPNLLAGEALVPEFFQQQVQGAALAGALQGQLRDRPQRERLMQRFRAIHEQLRQDGAAQAARAIVELLAGPR